MLKKAIQLAALCLLFSVKAYANHPLITDDSDTQGKGHFQIELDGESSTNTLNAQQKRSAQLAAILSAGITNNIDLLITLPHQWQRLKQDGITQSDTSEFDDMRTEMKWRFFDPEDQALTLALKPGISIPTGKEQNGPGSGKLATALTFIATHKGALGTLHCNFGYRCNAFRDKEKQNAARQNIWLASLAAELNTAAHLRTVLNIGIESNEARASDSNPAVLLGGVIYSLSENLDLDLGLKGGLNSAAPDTTMLAGLTAHF